MSMSVMLSTADDAVNIKSTLNILESLKNNENPQISQNNLDSLIKFYSSIYGILNLTGVSFPSEDLFIDHQ
jgi:hypothetical protein